MALNFKVKNIGIEVYPDLTKVVGALEVTSNLSAPSLRDPSFTLIIDTSNKKAYLNSIADGGGTDKIDVANRKLIGDWVVVNNLDADSWGGADLGTSNPFNYICGLRFRYRSTTGNTWIDLINENDELRFYNVSSGAYKFRFNIATGVAYAEDSWQTFCPAIEGLTYRDIIYRISAEIDKPEPPKDEEGNLLPDEEGLQPGTPEYDEKYAKRTSDLAIYNSHLLRWLINKLKDKGIISEDELNEIAKS